MTRLTNIIVPYTVFPEVTADVLDFLNLPWSPVDVSGGDDHYFNLLSTYWSRAQDLCVIEHDIVPTSETIDSLLTCPAPWCAAPYPYLHFPAYTGLGCTRFRAELMTDHPDLFAEVARMSNEFHPPRHWCSLDSFIQTVLSRRRVYVHAHLDFPVRHLGDNWPSHGCHGLKPQ